MVKFDYMRWDEVMSLVRKDLRLEFRQRWALNGILLYVFSTVFVTYLAFSGKMDTGPWNALFWIIMLFASVNAATKSFVQESNARQLFYYFLVSPQAVILAKIIYNLLLMLVIALLCYGVFVLFMGSWVVNHALFIAALLLGSSGFAGILTMVAAIAGRSGNNFALMAVLSFPLVLPLLLTLIKVSAASLTPAPFSDHIGNLLVLLLLNLLVVALGWILFPYLWRD